MEPVLEEQRVAIRLESVAGAEFCCPECGEKRSLKDHAKQRESGSETGGKEGMRMSNVRPDLEEVFRLFGGETLIVLASPVASS